MVDETLTVGDLSVPTVGLGTWELAGKQCYDAVSTALELGYRHIDTAQLYENEWAVGRAIADADVDREDVFVTTKINPLNRSARAIRESVDASLDRLGVDAVDLLLIHWPNPLADLETVMTTMSDLQVEGKTRHIGVSNFGVDRLEQAREYAHVPIATDQVQFHPFYPQRELLNYCQQEDVALTAYSPLAQGGVLRDDLLAEIGRRYGKSPAQVALRWAIQHEHVHAIPKSTSRDHLADNLDVFDFSLSRAEHDRITRPSLLKTGLATVRGRLG
jgi:diketogulonate reductase-like aldo/keto reductase